VRTHFPLHCVDNQIHQ
jgi:hypothetical protein